MNAPAPSRRGARLLRRLPARRPDRRRRAVVLRQPAPGRPGQRHAPGLPGHRGRRRGAARRHCIAQNAAGQRHRRQPARRLQHRRRRRHRRPGRRDRRAGHAGAGRRAVLAAAPPRPTPRPNRRWRAWAPGTRIRCTWPATRRCTGCRPRSRSCPRSSAVLCVVATPREAFAVFGGYLLLLAAVWVLARIPPAWMARRALIEAPFVVLAVLLPFTGGEPYVPVARAAAVRAGAAGRLEHPGQGHPRGAHLADPGRHHPAARAAARPAAAARPGAGRHHRHADAALRRRHRGRGPADAAGPDLPRPRPAVPVAGRGDRARRRSAVRPLLRAGRAGAPGHAVPRLDRRDAPALRRRRPPGGSGRSASPRSRWRSPWPRSAGSWRPPWASRRRPSRRARRRRCRSPGWPSPTPTATRRCYGVDLPSGAASGSRCSGPNGAGKTTLVLHLNGILDRRARLGRRRRAGGGRAEPARRSAAGSASSSRTRTTSCSCPPSARTSRSGRRTSGSPAPSCAARVDDRAGRRGHGRAPRPLAAAPVRRAAPPGGAGHRAGLRAGDPGARRAVVEPRPGGPPRAGRGAARPGRAPC